MPPRSGASRERMIHLDTNYLIGLAGWVERAMAGEQILIRQGGALVELRPADPASVAKPEPLPPREALRRMQEEARLKPEQAGQYLREVRDERLAAEERRHP